MVGAITIPVVIAIISVIAVFAGIAPIVRSNFPFMRLQGIAQVSLNKKR
jgi:hypothetical protein